MPLPVYLSCVRAVRRVQEYLDELVFLDAGDARNLQFYVTAAMVIELTGHLQPTAKQIIDCVVPDKMTTAVVQSSFERAKKIYLELSQYVDGDTVARGTEFTRRLRAQMKRRLKKAKAA